MLKKVAAVIGIVGWLSVVTACEVGPDNVFGVIFNDGEAMDLSVIEEIGEKGVNYDESTLSDFSYRSHYNSSILVEISDDSITETKYRRGVLFTADTNVVELNSVKADSCVYIELKWLIDAGIISMDLVTVKEIFSAFGSYTGVFYWTKQDSALSNEYGYSPDGALWAYDSDCGGDYLSADLPPEELSLRTGIIPGEEIYRNIKSNRFSLDNKEGSTLIDIRGRRVKSVNGDVRGLKSANIILEYNPETGVIRRRVSMPE